MSRYGPYVNLPESARPSTEEIFGARNDPDVGIEWPFPNPILSRRDQNQLSLKQYLQNPAFK